MGQLEKYGLYVLCLVIFLILGVTIWGEPDGARPNNVNPAAMNASRDLGDIGGSPRTAAPADTDRSGGNVVDASLSGRDNSLASLLQPPEDFGKKPDNKQPAKGGTPTNGEDKQQPKSDPKAEPKAEPVLSGTRDYKVKKGDNLERIARSELGSASRVEDIKQLNPGLDPRRMQIGQTIKLPMQVGKSSGAEKVAEKVVEPAKAAGAKPVPVSGGEALQRAGAFREYKIGKGDSLDRIARLELGSATRVSDIQQLNPGLDPLRLQIGQTIKLPIR